MAPNGLARTKLPQKWAMKVVAAPVVLVGGVVARKVDFKVKTGPSRILGGPLSFNCFNSNYCKALLTSSH
jgi:hypothetical protein